MANTVFWDGGTDFLWTTAANWSTSSVPGSSNDVVLDEEPFGSPYTVTLSGGTTDFNARSLAIDNTSGLTISSGGLEIFAPSQISGTPTLGSRGGLTESNATLNVTGVVNIVGNTDFGSLGGLGISKTTIASGGTLNVSGTFGGAILGGTLENDGTATLTGNFSMPAQNTTFINANNLTVNTAGSLTCGIDNFDTFNNSGSFTKLGNGSIVFEAAGELFAEFTNSGTIDVKAGTLELFNIPVAQLSGQTLSGGTWIVRNGATFKITGGPNIATLGASATVTLDGATSVFANINSLTNNQGNFTITDGRNFTSTAAFSNSGTLKIGPSSTFEATAALTSTGTIDIAGGTLKLDTGLASGTVFAQLQS